MKKSTLALTLLALSLAATAHSNAWAATAHTAAGKATASASKARKQGFTALAATKSGSGVALAYHIDSTPVVGSPLTIRVSMASSADAQVTLRAGDGLTLNNPDQVLSVQAGQSAEYTITVVPQTEGRFYLNLFSVAAGRGSANAIAVQVGKGVVQLKPAGKVQITPSGERIISVPAQ